MNAERIEQLREALDRWEFELTSVGEWDGPDPNAQADLLALLGEKAAQLKAGATDGVDGFPDRFSASAEGSTPSPGLSAEDERALETLDSVIRNEGQIGLAHRCGSTVARKIMDSWFDALAYLHSRLAEGSLKAAPPVVKPVDQTEEEPKK